MYGNINEVRLMGRIGNEPEIRHTQGGKRKARFRVITNEYWKDRETGEQRDHAEGHNIVVYNDFLAGVIEKHGTKGGRIVVDGKLRTRKYEADGKDAYITEIVVDGPKGDIQLIDPVSDSE